MVYYIIIILLVDILSDELIAYFIFLGHHENGHEVQHRHRPETCCLHQLHRENIYHVQFGRSHLHLSGLSTFDAYSGSCSRPSRTGVG